jgi:hypothetical protein
MRPSKVWCDYIYRCAKSFRFNFVLVDLKVPEYLKVRQF